MKEPENRWLSSSKIPLMAIPYMFFSISHAFYYVSVSVSPVFWGISHVVLWTCCKFWPMINIFSKTIIQKEANYVFFYQTTKNNSVLRLFADFIHTQKKVCYISWKNMHPCHSRPKFFFWAKLFQNCSLQNISYMSHRL